LQRLRKILCKTISGAYANHFRARVAALRLSKFTSWLALLPRPTQDRKTDRRRP